VPEKPKTQREMLHQLWNAIIGTDGKGLAQRWKRFEEQILPTLVTHDDLRRAKEWRLKVYGAVLGTLTASAGIFTLLWRLGLVKIAGG